MNTSLKEKTNSLYEKLTKDLLYKVNKPAQYLGIEWNRLVDAENFNNKKAKAVIVYPDLYELGLANFGIKILYKIINNHKEYLCDRSYAPMKDMEDLLKKENIPLWGWETYQPITNFELIGFSLSYELSYTNVLNLMELSKLNVFSNERKNIFPLIFAGGPCTFNPEPMADFFDFFIIGDGEEVLIEILDTISKFKENQKSNIESEESKESLLLALANIQGVYVPRFYSPDINNNYLPKRINTKIPETITKRVASIKDFNHPTGELVPYLATVHDRQVLEIRRGCDRGCRFCQPGYAYLPVRERTPENLIEISKQAIEKSGYDEYSLLSLSASDYTRLHELAIELNNEHKNNGVSMSMPSQRADRFDMTIANELNTTRKSGITLAPEAGTERLRAVINKGLKEEEIKQAITNVYKSGFKSVKLYFMIGLPTETNEDLDGIINLLEWIKELSKEQRKRPLEVTCTISTFVPKPCTPFQWEKQNSTLEFLEKIRYLKNKVKERRLFNVKLNCTDPKIALLEVVLSRGDRRLCKIIYDAYKNGSTFDAWGESLDISNWIKSAEKFNYNFDQEATRHRDIGEVSPWEIIDSGLLKKFLIEEARKAYDINETLACTENSCHACGVCFDLNVVNEVSENKSKNNKFVEEIKQGQKKSINKLDEDRSNQKHDLKKLLSKTIQRYEVIHTKTQDLKYISHLDLQRVFERATRRANLKVAYTEGFNQRQKMSWIMPLPIFYESEYEVLYIDLLEDIDNTELINRLNDELPNEITILEVKKIEISKKIPNPADFYNLYKVKTNINNFGEKYICELKSNLENFLRSNSQKIQIFKSTKDQSEKIQKEIDIRPLTREIKVFDDNDKNNNKSLIMEVLVTGNLRPEYVLNYLSPKESHINEEDLSKNWQTIWEIKKIKTFNG